MKAPQLFDASGRPLQVGNRIGKGGEGEVYTLADNDNVAVKVYTLADLTSRHAKILAMIRADLAQKAPLAAFPISIVKNHLGAFAGFTMSKVSAHEPLHELYSPAARKASFPRADYRFLTRAAANLSRAIASVHGSGCVIGDINHSGILVSQKATVTLIDADSFQVIDGGTQHLCKVGVPEYTPPELQGQRLDSVLRTTNHDEFGLAVAIFLILWMGRHPFSGRYQGGDMPMEKAIKELRFAYTDRAVGMQPPPAVPLLRDFPIQIRNAMETAFGPAGLTKRPSAAQWVELLKDLEQNLRVCKDNSLHHYPSGASECPWCRMERLQGVQVFLPPMFQSGEMPGVAVDPSASIAALWAAIEKIAGPAVYFSPILPTLNPKPSDMVAEEKGNSASKKWFGGVLILVGSVVVAALQDFALFGIGAVIWGAAQLFTETRSRSRVKAHAAELETQWLKALYAWEARCSSAEFNTVKGKLTKAKQALADLPGKETQLIAAYQRNRPAEQLTLYLEKFRIRQFKIKGIGPSKLAALASFGIETAADVAQNAILQVPGFGPVNSMSLVEWRNKIASRHVYDSKPNAQDQVAVGRIRAEIQREATQLRAELSRGPEELKRLVLAVEQRRRTADPVLLRLHEQREQLKVDLNALGMTAPNVTPPPRPAVGGSVAPTTPTVSINLTNTSTTINITGGQTPSCPRCGGGMAVCYARRGRHNNKGFWRCTSYPRCTGTRNI